jgi:hypothetical protein
MTTDQTFRIRQLTGCELIGISPFSDLIEICDLSYHDVWLVFANRSKNRLLSKDEIRQLKLIDLNI